MTIVSLLLILQKLQRPSNAQLRILMYSNREGNAAKQTWKAQMEALKALHAPVSSAIHIAILLVTEENYQFIATVVRMEHFIDVMTATYVLMEILTTVFSL